MLILKVQQHPRHKDILNLTLSDDTILTISREVYFKNKLRDGKELNEEELAGLLKEERYNSCFQASLNLLKYRPRSERELKQRLLSKGFPPDAAKEIILKLKSMSLIDDSAFASLWVDSRKNSKSRRVLNLELRKKGVSSDISGQVTSSLDEESTALAIGKKKARSLSGIPQREFQRKILSHLLQKGFDYEISRKTVRVIMLEMVRQEESSPSNDKANLL